MDLNLNNLISKYVNYKAPNVQKQVQQQNVQQNFTPQTQNSIPQSSYSTPQLAEMAKTDQSLYVKEMMKMPKNLNEFLYMLQRNITLAQFNQRFQNAQRNSISQTQAQILAQLQGLSNAETQNLIMNGNKAVMNMASLKNLAISPNALINLSDISLIIQANGKDAIAKLITTMASSAKLGVQDLTQLKETAKLINASVAAAAQNDSAQTMKLLLLLYLPWLPLQEGVGFDLEIEAGANPNENDSVLIITITTLNFEKVVATLILENSNSVHVNIECLKEFPKDELMLRIQADEKHYSMQSNVSFETTSKVKNTEKQEKPQAKINMSNTNEVNPYLLLMAHTIIRHVMEIDKNRREI